MKLLTCHGRFGFIATLLAALGLAGCATRAPVGSVPGQLSDATAPVRAVAGAQPHASVATTARAYRQDAARHVYAREGRRIHAGKLPPLLYAIGTLQVHIDQRGAVTSLHWLRAPQHAPEVIAETERTVLADAPYPAPEKLGSVTWTDTWLWDRDGTFQLDTLSEGQQ